MGLAFAAFAVHYKKIRRTILVGLCRAAVSGPRASCVRSSGLAGEWKIKQAAAALASATDEQESSTLPSIDACGIVLVEAMKYVVQLAEQRSDKDLPLSGDAVLHIRRSSEEALNATGQCMGLPEQRSKQIDGAAVRVLGAFLTEIDAFETTGV